MAPRKRPAGRPVRPQSSGPEPRRLGGQQQNTKRSSGAERRYQRSQKSSRSTLLSWGGVAVVIIVVVVLIVVKVTGGKTPTAGSSGQDPPLASAALVASLTHIPASTFNSVGVAGQAAPLVVTKNQPKLTENGLPRVVYVGAEYCPYCAMTRWSIAAAVARFGTFTGLKSTTSSADFPPIPTLSFVGSTFKSKYIVFSPYETEDRNGNPLESQPTDVAKLFATYDGTGSVPTKFTSGSSPGIPFIDIGNQFVSAGAPNSLDNIIPEVEGGGPGANAIAAAIANPNSVVGKAISAKYWVAEANFLTAGICATTGQMPKGVCDTPGVHAAQTALAKIKPIS